MSIIDVYLFHSNLNALLEWCIGNDIVLNPEKCKIITFSRSRFTLSVVCTTNDVDLERVDSIKDTGVIFDKK